MGIIRLGGLVGPKFAGAYDSDPRLDRRTGPLLPLIPPLSFVQQQVSELKARVEGALPQGDAPADCQRLIHKGKVGRFYWVSTYIFGVSSRFCVCMCVYGRSYMIDVHDQPTVTPDLIVTRIPPLHRRWKTGARWGATA